MKKLLKAAMAILVVSIMALPAIGVTAVSSSNSNEEKKLPDVFDIAYQCYTNEDGWSEWKADGESLETGDKEATALKVQIGDNLLNQGKTIMYRIYVQDFGWQDWVSNGEETSYINEGKKLRIEAVQAKIVDKDGNYSRENSVSYKTWTQNYNDVNSDVKTYYDGETSGTTNKCWGIVKLQMKVNSSVYYPVVKCWTGIDEKLSENIQGVGGTENLSKPVSSISIDLPDELKAQGMSIKYRVLQNNHDGEWSGWVQNGEIAGQRVGVREDLGDFIEAIQIKLVDNSGKELDGYKVRYIGRVEDQGVESVMKHDGKTSGTLEDETRLEQIKIDIKKW